MNRAESLRALYSGLAADPVARSLNMRELQLLEALCDGAGLREAAPLIGLSYVQCTRLVRRMIDLGVVERRWDPKAARLGVIATKKGRALQARVSDMLTQQRTAS